MVSHPHCSIGLVLLMLLLFSLFNLAPRKKMRMLQFIHMLNITEVAKEEMYKKLR